MKIDLTKNGLESMFNPWEIKLLNILVEGGEHTSGTLLTELNLSMETNLSQASVLNFLEKLTAFGIAVKLDGTGTTKGKRGVYSFPHNMATLKNYLASLAENWALYMRNNSSTKTVKQEAT